MDIKHFSKKALQKVIRNLYGLKKNKVVFCSFNGKAYSDNPKAISEKLHAIAPDTDIVWLFSEPEKKKQIVPAYVKCVTYKSQWTFWKEICTCGVFVTNFILPVVDKNKKQYFIQTWHGDKAFKKVLLDATRSFVPEQVAGYCDLAVAGSDYGERQYRSAFGYTGNVIKVGTPRNDKLLNSGRDEIEKIKKRLGLSNDVGVLLYAPTIRDQAVHTGVAQRIQEINISATLEVLKKKDKREWVCLVRAHPGAIGLTGIDRADNILNVSDYEDMCDLLLVSDMLVTDYSSTAGDYVLLNRPVILFHSDIEDYSKNTRALYFDVNQSPYFRVKSQKELEKLIEKLDDEMIRANCSAILDFYGDCETGNAGEEIAKIIAARVE